MSALRFNSKKGPNKKAGRKRPRPGDTDVEIIEAPDSELSYQPRKKQNQSAPEIITQQELDSAYQDDNPGVQKVPWVKDLDLYQSDKDIILNGEWLTCAHMKAVNKICQTQFQGVNGFQCTSLAAKYDDNKKKWVIPDTGFESRSAPSCNLHYNGYHHWVCTFQYVNNGPVYLLDSMMNFKNPRVNTTLQLQIAQIYGSGQDEIIVMIPEVQEQIGGNDCGLFAIANMIEFCSDRYNGLPTGRLMFEFCQDDMRQRLIECLSSKSMKPFPKVQKNNTIKMHSDPIPLECCCKLTECFDNMVECKMCGTWKFYRCENLKNIAEAKKLKMCSECKSKQSLQ